MSYPGFPAVFSVLMALMALASVVFWVALVALAVFLVVRLSRPRERPSDAKAILDERFARGEIDAEEYRSRLDLLKH